MDGHSYRSELEIKDRLRRSKGRSSRDCMANARVTEAEKKELEAAALASGSSLSEWSREILLREVRAGNKDRATLTELIALRMLMSTVLRTIAIGETLTPEAYAQILSEIRAGKHETTQDVLTQYALSYKEQSR